MASSLSFVEDNGARSASFEGTTRTLARTEVNWKNVDDSTTAYSSSPVTAGNNSFPKYQAGMITGTFNQLTNGKFGHTTGTFGAGITLWGGSSTGYITPTAASIFVGAQDCSTPSGISQAAFTVNFGNNPHTATTGTVTTTGYTNYLITQIATTTGASPGDSSTLTFTLQYDES